MSRKRPFELEEDLGQKFSGAVAGADLGFEEIYGDIRSSTRLERPREESASGRFLFLISFAVVGLLVIRLFNLTVTRHEELQAVAEGNRLRIEYLNAARGIVLDKFGRVLASSKPSSELVLFPFDLPEPVSERMSVVAKIAEVLEINSEDLVSLIPKSDLQIFESVLVKQNLTRDQALVLRERERELPGFRVVNTPIRDYKINPEGYSHLFGYVGKLNEDEYENLAQDGYLYNDSVGKTGLEQSYETELRGVFGQRQVEVDARGVVKKIFGSTEAKPGANLILNVDAELQDILYASLSERLRGLDKRKAAAIAMDPQSGKVLAYVSLPGYDNNDFAEGLSVNDYRKLAADRDQPLFNRAIRGVYPPGSTVKPMVAIAALEENIISGQTLIKDEGAIVIKNIYGGPDSVFIGYGRRALGLLNLRKAIALSSDIFFYILGGGFGPAKIEGLGIERLAKYFRMFKLNETLGIDLPGEQPGLVPDPEWKKQYFAGDEFSEKWYLGDTYHVSIGQGDLLVSPLHVLSWTATVANGGKIFRPFVVDRVEKDGQILKKNEPQIVGEIAASRENIQAVQGGMREAVLSGTATSLQRLPISSAAKTGTAQFDAKNRNRSHAWFTAYAPFENPQIAITVLIEDGGEGGVNSMPVVRDTLNWWAVHRYQP